MTYERKEVYVRFDADFNAYIHCYGCGDEWHFDSMVPAGQSYAARAEVLAKHFNCEWDIETP